MKQLFLLIGILLLASCASSRRMMRVSPFSDGHDVLAPNLERTNLFPLFYKNGDTNSALWPLIDWDDEGFAFRPLFNQDGDDVSILFPLSSWNAPDKDGWVTSFYWDYKPKNPVLGMFPLFRYENDGFHHYGPVWKGDDTFGLFPIMGQWDDFGYYGPVWKQDDEFGVFPLFGKWDSGFHVLNFIHDDDENWFFPFLYHDKGRRFWFSEIYDWHGSSNGDSKHEFLSIISKFTYEDHKLVSNYLFPLWYHRNRENDKLFLSPLIYNAADEDSEDFHIFPLWYSSENRQNRFNTLLPLWLKLSDEKSWHVFTLLGAFGQDDRDKSQFMITPLFGYGSSESGDYSFKNLLGPVYLDYKNGDSEFTSFLWPLYSQSSNKNEKSWHAFSCLINHTVSDYKTNTMVFPLTSHTSWENGSENYSLLGLFHSKIKVNTTEGPAKSNRIWPLYSYSEDGSLDDAFYNTFLTLLSIENRENHLEYELLNGLLYNYTRTGDAENPKRVDTGNLLYSYGSFNDIEEDLHYSYSYNSYDIHSGFDWRFLFYNFDHNDIVYMDETLLNKKEKDTLRRFDFDQHTNLPQAMKNKRSSSSFINSYSRKVDPGDTHKCKNCLETHKVMNKKGYKCDENYKSIKAAYQTFLKENLKYAVGREHYIPLLFEGKSTHKESEWEFLFGLSKYKSKGDKHHFSILKFLYKEDAHGENVARDVFPFIQLDSGEKSGFSFFGHHSLGFLLNWKHDKEKGHHGHFLFIPWG